MPRAVSLWPPESADNLMQRQDDFAAWRSLKLTRLLSKFHSIGGPFTFTAQDRTEFVDAFYRIAQDGANKIVILTGAGGEFIPETDFSSFGNVADSGVWSQVHDEGVQHLESMANIRVPVMSAIAGCAHVHSEYALVASAIVAAEVRPSTMFRTSPEALCRAMEFLPRGVIALEQDERRHPCSTHSRRRRAMHTNGESLARPCPTIQRSAGRENRQSCT